MISKPEAIKKILWASIEDYVAIWELPWELTSLSPKSSENQKIKLCKDILKIFLQQKLVKLYSCKEPYGDLEEISNEENEYKLMEDSKIWEIENNAEIEIRVCATEKGEKFYNKGNIEEILSLWID